MDSTTELTERYGQLTSQMKAATDLLEAAVAEGRTADAETRDGIKTLAAELTELKGKIESAEAKAEQDRILAEAKAFLADQHAPSKADIIGQGRTDAPSGAKGELITALYNIRPGATPDEYAAGKAMLERIGLSRSDAAGTAYSLAMSGEGKATLGSTGPTGGYVLPNNLVDRVIKPNTQKAIYQNLVTVRSGVTVRGVDLPYRTSAPARMTVQDWGSEKDNVDEAYGTYTASLVTIARIYDVSKQYLRFSAGSAEEDVIDELTKGAALGENYYIMFGDGTAGNNGEPYGIVPAIEAGAATYETSHSPVGNTILGSAATGFAKMLGALAARNRDEVNAIVVDAASYWTLLAQGSDAAGFWANPESGPTGFSRIASGGIAFWGVPVYYDANLTAKYAIAGEFQQTKLFRGMEFRIESSDQAGTRWDKNLVGFRGEEEIGFNAASAVSVGAFQLCKTIVP